MIRIALAGVGAIGMRQASAMQAAAAATATPSAHSAILPAFIAPAPGGARALVRVAGRSGTGPTVPEMDRCCACFNVHYMARMIQIRNVPDALHRRLKSRAALAGVSLSDYLLREIRAVAERPSVEELRVRLERRSEVLLSTAPADVIRAERDRI